MTVNLEWENPKWSEAAKVHDWRNHVSEEIQSIWNTFTYIQKLALFNQATELANMEEWD